MLMALSKKSKKEYLTDTAWLKFYNTQSDNFYFYNFLENKKTGELSKVI